MEIREQILHGFMLSRRQDLYSFDVDIIEEVTYKVDFVTINVFMKLWIKKE